MRKGLLFLVIIILYQSCGGKKSAPIPATTPGKAVLATPAKNSLCVTGAAISATESSVTFSWNASDNTDEYDLVVKNLLTSTISNQTTPLTQLAVTLLQNTPYSWYIVSKSKKNSTTTQSDSWKFYNSGSGIITYAPFPAEIISPAPNEIITSATADLSWKGSATDPSTIANYDIYFGSTNTPLVFKTNLTDTVLKSVNLASNTTYYWRVVTRDISGNTSDSGLFQFRTK